MATQLRFVKLHLKKPQDFWNNVWKRDTKVFYQNAEYKLSSMVVEAYDLGLLNYSVHQSILELRGHMSNN